MQKYTLKIATKSDNYCIDYAKHLNSEQMQVVTAREGVILVIAGAGTGKTRTVTYRVARLMESGIPPEKILLVTFTNKASREMLRRVESLIGSSTKKIWGGTFHHIGNLILKKEAHLLGYQSNYSILDQEDAKNLLGDLVAGSEAISKDKWFPKGSVLAGIISFATNTQKTVKEVIVERYPFFAKQTDKIEQIAIDYFRRKKKMNLMDFDDLLLNWKILLENFSEIRDHYSQKFSYILVDEYQDTNLIQADIIDLLTSHHRNLMAVGDDSQSIYSFRGANFANIIDFPKRYPDAKIFKLETNYRSTPEILNLSNLSIAHNQRQFPKTLKASRASGAIPALVALGDTLKQADFVSQRILELQDEGISLNDISVLYRAHYHSMELQMELTRKGIPFEVRSGLKFFEQAHIKDVTAFLRIIVNPFDELAWKRSLKLYPRVGHATAGKICKYLFSKKEPLRAIDTNELVRLVSARAKEGIIKFFNIIEELKAPEMLNSPSGMIDIVIKNGYQDYLKGKYTNYESRMDDLNQLAGFAVNYQTTEDFLRELTLTGILTTEEISSQSNEEERVTLSSIHQAKGLEWLTVFIIWCAEGRFPLARGLEENGGEEEERRLFYVATTRAKDELYLCFPLMGESRNYTEILLKPSRFIKELEGSPYEEWMIEESYDLNDFSY